MRCVTTWWNFPLQTYLKPEKNGFEGLKKRFEKFT